MHADQGKAVEEEGYKLFPEVKRVCANGPDSVAEAKSLIGQGYHRIGQAGFMTEDFFAQADIVCIKENNHVFIIPCCCSIDTHHGIK